MLHQNKKRKNLITCPHCEMEVICPFCKSKEIRKIVYGLLSITDKEAFEKKYIPGGCVVEEDSPMFYCKNCGKKFGSLFGGNESLVSSWKKRVVTVFQEIEKLKKEKKELEKKVSWLRETQKNLRDIIKK